MEEKHKQRLENLIDRLKDLRKRTEGLHLTCQVLLKDTQELKTLLEQQKETK